MWLGDRLFAFREAVLALSKCHWKIVWCEMIYEGGWVILAFIAVAVLLCLSILQESGAEGIVIKHLESRYHFGSTYYIS